MKHIVNLMLFLLLPFIFKGNITGQEQLFAPNLISPEHKSNYVTVPKEFIWNSVDSVARYSIQITNDVTFLALDSTSDILIDKFQDTILRVESNKIYMDTIYFWRVKTLKDTIESEWSFIRMFITGVTNIDENNSIFQINPHPIKDYANIVFDNDRYADLKCFIFTSSGILLNSQKFSEQNNIIDFSKCYTGHYYIIITSNNNIIAKKSVIVE